MHIKLKRPTFLICVSIKSILLVGCALDADDDEIGATGSLVGTVSMQATMPNENGVFVGDLLTANYTTDGSQVASVQWYADDVPVATGNSFTPRNEHWKKNIKVCVSSDNRENCSSEYLAIPKYPSTGRISLSNQIAY